MKNHEVVSEAEWLKARKKLVGQGEEVPASAEGDQS
jgi:hypothetical protein